MPVLTRTLARQFRAVLRRGLPNSISRNNAIKVRVNTTTDSLTLSAVHDGVGVRVTLPGPQEPADFGFPAQLLAEFEGRDDTPVTFELTAKQPDVARWTDRGVPRVVDFERTLIKDLPGWPDPPTTTATFDSNLLAALATAADIAARDAARYALNNVRLRGRAGEIIATDSKQLLVQRGFRFPWTEDVLVPRFAAWDSRELPADAAVIVGKSENAVCITVGSWAFALKIDGNGRFPDHQGIVPTTDNATAVRFSDGDAAFLLQTVPRMPAADDDIAVVTLDLGETVRVRARAANRVIEAVAATSTVTGAPVIVPFDRRYLLTALRLGFRSIQVTRPEVPLVCRDDRRLYLWMPLDRQVAVAATPEALRVVSDAIRPANNRPERPRSTPAQSAPAQNGAAVVHSPLPTEKAIMSANASNHDSTNGHAGHSGQLPDLYAMAEEVRAALSDANGKVLTLMSALKQQKRQTRAVEAAMASLRRLQTIER